MKRKSFKRRNLKKSFLFVLAASLMIVFSACNSSNKINNNITNTPEITDIQKITNAPISTEMPIPTRIPEITDITESSVYKNSAFPLVTPVPDINLFDIKETISKEDYPIVDGSTATIPLSEAVFMYATGENKETAQQTIKHTKTTNSYSRLYNKEVDLLIVYEPAASIIERMKTEELIIKPIGLDALVFMGNTANPVVSLTNNQIVDIYSGKIKNWQNVGGANKELLAFQRPEGSGSQTLMQKLVMKDVSMIEGDNVFRYSTMSDILEGMLEYTGDDNTLGYSVFYYANNMYNFPELKFIGVNGVIPSTQTIYDGSYPYVNAFYAVIRPDEPEGSNARKIFDWLTGSAGQRMILELGYVPVIMPDGETIDDVFASKSNTEINPDDQMEENEHYIFFRAKNNDWDYTYGNVSIYDHNWNKCDSFYNVSYLTVGVTDDRYIVIEQLRHSMNEENNSVTKVYDLYENKFIENEWFEGANIEVIDGKRGYFLRNYKEIIDIRGNVLVESKEYLDQPQRYDNFYVIRDYDNCLIKIYDLDFNLKNVRVESDSDILPEAEIPEGVIYYSSDDSNCILDKNGDIAVSKEDFLKVFGDGTDKECRILSKNYFLATYETSDNYLYEVQYGDELYYIDRNLSFYLKQNDDKGQYINSAAKDDEIIYYYNDYNYFSADGEKFVMEDGSEPSEIQGFNNESYVLIKQQENLIIAEEHIPKENFVKVYKYSTEALSNYIEYMGNHMFMITDISDFDEEQRNIIIYNGDKLICNVKAKAGIFDRENDFIFVHFYLENLSEYHNQEDGDVYIDYIDMYKYLVIKDGEALFVIDEIRNPAVCHDGYIQVNIGNYIYVYDYNKNIILKALNDVLEAD